ncbi:CorA family divalent cation transporter [Caminibacter pacificus]
MANRIFFLGGCDLEMCAIKRLLDKYGEKYVDKNLKWGAKTSQILDEFEKYKNYDKIYLIEFEDDAGVLKWENVEHIDHHNENSDKPSSLEQLAYILGHKLSRFEKAVALNDKGYIPALNCACIGKSDIQRIRKLDRKCQGVTKEEEEAAAKAELKEINYFPYEHFSPLSDRLYMEGFEKYVIYNDNLTMFYGYPVDRLKKIFKDKKFFCGGGTHGYFGIEEKLSEYEIKEAIKGQKKEISTHTFILPFFIKDKNFIENIEKKGFEKKKYEIKSAEFYNEYIYFYPYTQKVLFGSKYYELALPENSKYVIKLKSGDVYELEIEDIAVRIFENNIAMLSFHLNNYDYSDRNDILKINDFGRRIFPQYITEEDILAAKNTFLPNCIELKLSERIIKEDFCDFLQNYDIKNNPQKLIPRFISELIGDNLQMILDDRMFVVSFYVAPAWLTEELKKDYVHNDWWYKYVFVDGGDKTCQDDEFCTEVIKKATYPRWRNYGTLWGVSRYSLVGVANEGGRFLMAHAKNMYFQMASLVLLYRSMILNLSNQVKDLIDTFKEDDGIDLSKIRKNSKKIYRDYLKFLNGIFFKEITAQEQGIEMYKMLLEVADIKEIVESFDREMEELDNYIDLLEEKERNSSLEFLSILGALFLPPSLVIGIMGMNNIDAKTSWAVTVIAILFSFLSGVFLIDANKITNYFKEISHERKVYTMIGVVILFAVITALLIYARKITP